MKPKARSSVPGPAKKQPASPTTKPRAAKPSPRAAAEPQSKGPVSGAAKRSVPPVKAGPAKTKKPFKPQKKTVPSATAHKSPKASLSKTPSAGARRRRRSETPADKVSEILLEQEGALTPRAGGPGQRYALGPVPVEYQPELPDEMGELPEAYGSKRLFLAARDPHWLYAHWDFTTAQLREANALSVERCLALRIFAGEFDSPPCSELRVHPESRNWFVHVGRGGTKYLAELGYYQRGDRAWVTLSRSSATLTPPDLAGSPTAVDFATIPVDVSFEELLTMVQAAAKENVPLAEAIQQLRATGYGGLPEPSEWPKTDWTPEQERMLAVAVAESVSLDTVRRTWVGSLEITELLRRRLEQQRGSAEMVSSAGLPILGGPAWGGPSSVSSPMGAEERAKGFWFMVNAELVVYGATEPDAQVTLAGRRIRLQPDGTFSFRFALPDGRYDLPAEAVSADGTDRRRAEMRFSRSTAYEGEVGVHPQNPRLKPPDPGVVE